MSRYSNSGTKENHAKLSFWSKQSIKQILLDQRMSFCLHRVDTPFCGDGIVQDGEVSFNPMRIKALKTGLIVTLVYNK